ncbi:MAG: hypothetical protein KY475_14580 [Planctomycetes bacterium]|nr:hypothetical protein [Planctomycetota bacterium]
MAANLEALREQLEADAPVGEFEPYMRFSKEADALTFYFKPDREHSKRLSDHVTLFLSVDTGEVVGCRVKGVAEILEDLPNYISVNHDGVLLSVLFLPFRGDVDESARRALNDLARAASERNLRFEPEPA